VLVSDTSHPRVHLLAKLPTDITSPRRAMLRALPCRGVIV